MATEPKTWRIVATRPFYHGLAVVQPGTEITVAYPFARELISNNKAVKVEEPAAPADAAPEAATGDAPAAKTSRKAKTTE